MKPNCEHCGDTGRLAGSIFFDCGHCDVAQERVELATFVQDFCANYSGMAELLPEDLNYAIHQRGQSKALAIVYPPDGTVAPFTVINLGSGMVRMGDSIHDCRLPALWFGKGGPGMVGVEEEMNRAAHDGETLAVVTFANVEGLDVLAEVVQRIRRRSFPDAPAMHEMTVKLDVSDIKEFIRQASTDSEVISAELIAAGWIPPNGDSPTRQQALDAAAHAIHVADAAGLVLTISQVPRQPLAMGNYSTRVEVREKLGR